MVSGEDGVAQVANSYVFSKSGTIKVNGFDGAIGEGGILSHEVSMGGCTHSCPHHEEDEQHQQPLPPDCIRMLPSSSRWLPACLPVALCM